MHPLDLVKTRFQLQSAVVVAGHHHYTSIAHCMKTMYHTEGFLSFWKGIIPPLFVETPKRAWKVCSEFLHRPRYHVIQTPKETLSLNNKGRRDYRSRRIVIVSVR